LQIFKIQASFSPDDPNGLTDDAFYQFWFAALERIQQFKEKELAQRKTRLNKFNMAHRKTLPVFRKMLRNKLSPEVAAQKVKLLVPDEGLLREIFDVWQKSCKTTPEQVAKSKEDIARREVELAKSGRLLKARESFQQILEMLAKEVEEDSAEGAEALADIAFQATCFLQIGEKKKPELFRHAARATQFWSVIANNETDWQKEALQRVGALELGEGLPEFRVRFRKARGTDANLPARLWAKAAVRTIEETQLRILSFGSIIRDFGSHQALADFCMETGWQIGEQPEWVHEVSRLKKFSRESLPSWKLAVRKLIREQMPDFQMRPEWSNQRNTAAASGRETPGEIKNAILDDITSALERLVPDSDLPKSDC
jgi:hypothetical protein